MYQRQYGPPNNSGSTQGKGSTSELNKSTHSNLSSKLGRDRKLTPQECQCCLYNKLCLLWHCWTRCQGLSKIQLSFHQISSIQVWSGQIRVFWHGFKKRLSSPWNSTRPKDCIELPHAKLLLSMHPLFQILTHLLFPWHLTPFQIWSWSPLWIPDLPTLSLILCCSDSASSSIWHSTYQTLTHQWNFQFYHLIGARLSNQFSYQGITEPDFLHHSVGQELHDCTRIPLAHPLQSLNWLGIGQHLFLATIAARIQELTLCWDTPSETSRPCPVYSETHSASRTQETHKSNPH